MGSLHVSKGEYIEGLAKSAEDALQGKGEVWKVEVDRALAGTNLQKNGSVGGSMLMLLWLIKDLGYEYQVDPMNQVIRIVPQSR